MAGVEGWGCPFGAYFLWHLRRSNKALITILFVGFYVHALLVPKINKHACVWRYGDDEHAIARTSR